MGGNMNKTNRGTILAVLIAVSMVSAAVVVQCGEGEASAYDADTVATITTDGTVYEYSSLAAAVSDAANGDTIVLVADISDFETTDIVTVDSSQELTLDLAGHTITTTSDFVGRPIVNYGTLTVTDSVGNGGIDSSPSENGGYGAINNYGTLSIYGGTFKGAPYANGSVVYNREGGTLYIADGTFSGATRAIVNMSYAVIDGGDFSNTMCSMCNSSVWAYTIVNGSVDSYMVINGGTVTGTQGAVSASVGHIIINDGTFKTVDCENNHGAIFYALYAAGEVGEVLCEVYGGTFTTEGKYAAALIGNDNTDGDGGINAQATAYIYGGTFIAPSGVTALKGATNTGDPIIYGGTFSSDPSQYVTLPATVTLSEGLYIVSIAAPEITLSGTETSEGVYSTDVTVTITTDLEGCSIAYTTDGSDPSTSSTAVVASSPVSITLSKGSTIRAMVVYDGLYGTEIETSFTITKTSTDGSSTTTETSNSGTTAAGTAYSETTVTTTTDGQVTSSTSTVSTGDVDVVLDGTTSASVTVTVNSVDADTALSDIEALIEVARVSAGADEVSSVVLEIETDSLELSSDVVSVLNAYTTSIVITASGTETLELDSTVVSNLGGDIVLTVTDVTDDDDTPSVLDGNTTYRFTLTSDGEYVSDLVGYATFSVNLTLASNQTATVYYYNEDTGTMSEVDSWYSDGVLTFSTDHFSLYTISVTTSGSMVIVPDDNRTTPSATTTASSGSDSTVTVVACAAAAVAAALMAAFIVIDLRRR